MVRFGYELVPSSSLSGDVHNEKWQKARAKLAQFLARNELEAVNSEVTAAISNSKGIVDYCHEKQVDLLIIGRHERHGMAAWLVGATADSILPNVPCDSLVVKVDEPVSELGVWLNIRVNLLFVSAVLEFYSISKSMSQRETSIT